MFIALQNAVSSEIISRITGEDLTQLDININRYPHPSHVQDNAVEFLQFLFPVFFTFAFSYTAVNIVRAVTVEKELQLKVSINTQLHLTHVPEKSTIYPTAKKFHRSFRMSDVMISLEFFWVNLVEQQRF